MCVCVLSRFNREGRTASRMASRVVISTTPPIQAKASRRMNFASDTYFMTVLPCRRGEKAYSFYNIKDRDRWTKRAGPPLHLRDWVPALKAAVLEAYLCMVTIREILQ